MLAIWSGPQTAVPAWSQAAPSPSGTKPASPPASSDSPASGTPASGTPASGKPAQAGAAAPQAPEQPKNPDQKPDQSKDKDKDKDQPGQKKDQNNDLNDQGIFVFRKDVDEVLLHASVVDDRQHIITTLDRSAFTVLEDGKPQNIISFHQEDIPVAMGILIDNSGSMKEKRSKVNQAALNLVRSSNPKDEVFVVNFNDEYYLDQDFTNNLLKLKEALEKIDARGGTALYDAVVASADHLKHNARLEKKVLFIVTDGEDNASNETLEKTVKRLQEENGPSVYAIGILGDEEHPKRAKKALDLIAQHTGGIAFFPKTLDEVDEISRTVARDIRNQYAIGYKPSNPRSNGGFRQIRVEAKAKGHGKMTVRTKSGYYAGAQPAAGSSK
ncbi:MAG: VWA domain-containing protein [Acidobacteria bacterium]|nr:MAG: VWA domain-containing protein [Acidobacteriota bacterium]